MAKVTIHTVVPPVAPVRNVTLVLSEGEARALVEVLSHVGGDPGKTARRHSDAVSNALVDAGIEPENDDDDARPLLRVVSNELGVPGLYFLRDLKGEVR